MKVGELCALLSAYPDDTPVVIRTVMPVLAAAVFEELMLSSYSVELEGEDIVLVFERVEKRKRAEFEWDEEGQALRQVTAASEGDSEP